MRDGPAWATGGRSTCRRRRTAARMATSVRQCGRGSDTGEAKAALLASMYPSVFPASGGAEAAPPRLLGLASALADDPGCSDLLPPFPVFDQAAFLLRDLPLSPATPMSPAPAKSCPSPAAVSSVFSDFRDPRRRRRGRARAAEGIDGIMGKLSMDNNAAAVARDSCNLPRSKIHPYLRSLMVLQALKRPTVDPCAL